MTKSEMRDVYTESVLPGGVVFVYVQPDLHFEKMGWYLQEIEGRRKWQIRGPAAGRRKGGSRGSMYG